MQFDENWIVEPINKDAKVSFVFEGNLQGFLQLLGPIAVRAWQKQAETDLARMKKFLETKA